MRRSVRPPAPLTIAMVAAAEEEEEEASVALSVVVVVALVSHTSAAATAVATVVRSVARASEDSPLRTLSVGDANSQPLSARVHAAGAHGDVGKKAAKASLIAQRLQRARSSGVLKMGGCDGGGKSDPWPDEVGVKVHPI